MDLDRRAAVRQTIRAARPTSGVQRRSRVVRWSRRLLRSTLLAAGVALGCASLAPAVGLADQASPCQSGAPQPTLAAYAAGSSEAAPPVASSDEAPARRWAWPLSPRPAVLRPYDAPPGPYAAGHRGVDLAAAMGQQVLSPTAGTVAFSGTVAGQPVVVIAHAGGLRSTFQPVTTVAPVGAAVARGDPVGTVAATPGHCAPAVCVHWGVLRGRAYLDPLVFVQGAPVVLLPMAP